MRLKIVILIAMALALAANAGAQGKIKKAVVTGFVTDADGKPVSEAIILVDRQNSDVTTNSKGYFKLRVLPDVKMIGAYSVTKGSGEVPFTVNEVLMIKLDGIFALTDFSPAPQKPEEEETVNIGYGTARKKDLTTHTQSIDATQDKYSSYTNIYEMLRGEIAGVEVIGTQVRIRGITSINSSNDPLFVVDGMTVNSLDMISPRSVKSVTVLKGPAASIYGSRGAGGVIIIELKGANDNK